MAATHTVVSSSEGPELQRLNMLRKLVNIHVEAWKKSLPGDLFASAYPTLHKISPTVVPELFEEFWSKLSDNIQVGYRHQHGFAEAQAHPTYML
jgi:hypothetical protein